MNMVKHIGRHDQRKVAIIYKTIPDAEHMALVVYTEKLPSTMHDDIMRVIESPEGQEANELNEVLFRTLLSNGNPILQSLHANGYLKKVECKQIIVVPNATSHIRLDELNKLLSEMEQGEDAKQRLQNLDNNAGLVDPTVSVKNTTTLAKQHINNAIKLETESKSLLAESKRLKKEAYKLDSSLKPKRKTTKKVKVKA